ncbi:MAG: lysophospholipid acyltransferase family protein [Desulfovibrionales bacterium]|nr:lysophospholipid acyltransferase family protein [Desulfovibrionales bacterium]
MNLNNSFTYSALTMLARAWSATLNYTQIGYEPILKLRSAKTPMVFAVYHGEIFPLFYLHQNEKFTVVVSKSRDGELIAQVLKRFGYSLARGSSSRQGLKALRDTARQMKHVKTDAVFTVDGPRGPRHKSKPGIVYLASRSRAFIVPVRVNMRTRHAFKSWDKFCLPWLWSECRVVYGRPYQVPHSMRQNEIQNRTAELDEKLQALL